MSKTSAATETKAVEAERGLGELRAEVESLKGAFASLALMLMPHHLRNYCACGRLACATVSATTPGAYEVRPFHLCDQCLLPDGWRESARVSLGPAERETVTIANGLGVFAPPAK